MRRAIVRSVKLTVNRAEEEMLRVVRVNDERAHVAAHRACNLPIHRMRGGIRRRADVIEFIGGAARVQRKRSAEAQGQEQGQEFFHQRVYPFHARLLMMQRAARGRRTLLLLLEKSRESKPQTVGCGRLLRRWLKTLAKKATRAMSR